MIHFELNKGASRIIIKKTLKKLGKIVFKEFKKSGIISIAIVSASTIKKINKEYRKKNKSTDILTFVFGKEGDCLGEILLSPADIKKRAPLEALEISPLTGRAKKSKKSIMETAVYLTVHGVCHIFGLTHKKKKDALEMEKMEIKILKKLK